MLNARKYVSMFALLLPCFLNASVDDLNTSIDDATVLAPWCDHGGCIEIYKNPCSEFDRPVNRSQRMMSILARIPPETELSYQMDEIMEEIMKEMKEVKEIVEEMEEIVEEMEEINNRHGFSTGD